MFFLLLSLIVNLLQQGLLDERNYCKAYQAISAFFLAERPNNSSFAVVHGLRCFYMTLAFSSFSTVFSLV